MHAFSKRVMYTVFRLIALLESRYFAAGKTRTTSKNPSLTNFRQKALAVLSAINASVDNSLLVIHLFRFLKATKNARTS